MVKIRLRRTGAKKQPHYRVVVAESKSPRDGKFIEAIGHYNPRTEPPTMEIDAERALHWLSAGAQPSAAVKRMLDKLGIMTQAAAIKEGKTPLGALELPPLAAEVEKPPVAEFVPDEAIAEALVEEEGEEDEGFDVDSFDEDEDLDESEDWETEAEEVDDSEDMEDDWEMDVEEDDDFDDDDQFDEDDD